MPQLIPILSTLFIGLLHGLEPGHGQTMLAAYILGEDIDIKSLLRMVFIMIITHFIMLLIISYALSGFLHSSSLPIEAILSWVAPILMLLFGIYLFYHKQSHTGDYCGCDHDHEHHNESHDHHQQNKLKNSDRTLISAISGFMPCPTVLSPIMLLAVGSNFTHVIFYVSAFVIGMSISITGVLLLFIISKDRARSFFERINTLVHPYNLTAIIIICISLVYIGLRAFR